MNYKSTSHLLHLILTIIFVPWVIVWIFCTLSNNQHNRRTEMQMMRESLEEMKRNRSN